MVQLKLRHLHVGTGGDAAEGLWNRVGGQVVASFRSLWEKLVSEMTENNPVARRGREDMKRKVAHHFLVPQWLLWCQ